MRREHHVVVIGGGFGGLNIVRELRRAPVCVTLLDRRNFHLFQPLLYQVATGGLSPANIAAPLRAVFSRQRNAQVLLAEAVGFDAARRRVLLRDGEVDYDTLVVATGATHNYFGRDEWTAVAPGLKSIEDATRIRARILYAFEAAERETEPARIAAWLTFVIVGAGPTGVELAGAIGEIARDTLRRDFRRTDPARARVLLLDAVDRVLPTYPADLSARAVRSLARLGVNCRTAVKVTDVRPGEVAIETGDGLETIHAQTVLWAAGVRASRLGRALAEAAGAQLDKAGRVIVEPDLSLPAHPEILVVGDLARFTRTPDGKPLPGVAPVAIQQARYAARLIVSRLHGRRIGPFRYKHSGSMATIGRAAAVADLGRLRFWGWPAWVAWLFVHLMQLVEFQNRALVLLQWAWNYFTRNRSARLITGGELQPTASITPSAVTSCVNGETGGPGPAGLPAPEDAKLRASK